MTSVRPFPLFILAGGRATRLGSLSENTPKFLQPLDKSTLFADVQLRWAAEAGFQHVILSIGYLGDQIKSYCAQGAKWNLTIEYVKDGPHLLGTGGAALLALKFPFESLAVTYGDTILKVPFSEVESLWNQHPEAQALMTVLENKVPGHQANAALEGHRIRYNKKNPSPVFDCIDYGYLILRRSGLEQLRWSRQNPTTPLDLAEPLQHWSEQNLALGYRCEERFWEIGTPEALEELRRRRLLF